MRDSRSGSAAADGSHDQDIELQNVDNSKGKGPDPELYTPDQLEQLQVPRRARPDVASGTLARRVLNTSQHRNLSSSQRSGMDSIDPASNTDATSGTPNTHRSVESPRNPPPNSQLNGRQLPGGELSSSPPPGSQFSALNSANSASNVGAIGRTQTSAQGVESSLSPIPLNHLHRSSAYIRMLSAIDDFNAFRARTMGISPPALEATEASRPQLFRIWVPENMVPRNRIVSSQSPVLDNVDPAPRTSPVRSIVKKHRDFYNTKGGDSKTVLQPKRYQPADFRVDSPTDAKGTSPSTKPASTQSQVDPGSSENSKNQLQSKTYHPVDFRPGSQRDAKGIFPSIVPASTEPRVDFDTSQHSETQLRQNTYRPAGAHPESGRNVEGISPSNKAVSGPRESDFNQEHSASSSTNSLTVKPLNIVKRRGAQQFAANPPQAQLPPSSTHRPSLSSNAERSSLASSYGNTASLLNLSVRDEVNVDESGPSRDSLIFGRGNGQASSSASPGNNETDTQSNNERRTTPNEFRFRLASTLHTSNPSSGRVSIIGSNGSVHSRPLSVHEAGVLERHIKAAMTHIERNSGAGSRSDVFATREEAGSGSGNQTSNRSEEHIFDLGPGGSQSASSHGALSYSASGLSVEEGREFLSRFGSSDGSSGGTAAMVTRTEYEGDEEVERGTSPVDWTNVIESRGRGHIVGEVDEEGGIVVNPETVEENRRIPRQTHLYTLARLTGSSVAGFTSSAEGSEDEGIAWTPPSQRENRRTYTRASRLETDGQNGNLILRPEYTFTGGAGFPHRDALTPSQANWFYNNTYQHPTPLSSDHVHPFRSSPPSINRAGASQHSYTRSQTSDGSLPMDVEDYVLQPNTYSGQHTYPRDTYYRRGRSVYQSEVEASGGTRNPVRAPMHEYENGLAAYDHSYTPFHINRRQPFLNHEILDQQQSLSSTHHQTSSQGRVGANRPQLYLPYRETSWGFSSPREYGFTHDILREHRRHLAAASLFPRAFTPPTPTRHLSPLHLPSLNFSSTPSGGPSIRADGPAGPSGGPTSLPPLSEGAQSERRRFVPAPHLIPNRRPSAAVLNRQRNLAAVIITVMGVCPPLLLIVGLGGMDPTMAAAMRGKVAGFTEAQRRVALGLGVGGTLGVLLGAIGAIIFLVLHP